jgi:hypothetical protein
VNWGRILFRAASAAFAGALVGLVLGLLAEYPWEDTKADAGAAASVFGLFELGRGVRARLRANREGE